MNLRAGAAAGGALALALLMAPRAARAGVPAVNYSAPEPCPSGDTLRAELRGLLEASGDAGDDFAFEITITPAGTGFRGTLRATAPNAAGPPREVMDTSCGAVVHALAFIAAVVVDPKVAERVEELGSSAAGAREGAAPSSTEPAPAEPTAPPRRESEPPAPVPAPKPAPRAAPVPAERAFRAGVLGAPALETSLGPDVALEARLGVFAASAPIWDGTGWLAGVSFVHGSSNAIKSSAGNADLSWTHGRADGCLSLPVGKPLLVYPCAFLDAGVIGGTGQLAPVKSRHTLWLAPGLLGRASLEFVNNFEFFVEAGGFAPLIRPRFVYASPDGDAVLHEVPGLGFVGGAGLAIRVL